MTEGCDASAVLDGILDRAETIAEFLRNGIEIGHRERKSIEVRGAVITVGGGVGADQFDDRLTATEIGRASCRERVLASV